MGGGLGDIFNQIYSEGRYNLLRDLEPGDTMDIHLFCHNPYASELFLQHPKASQITVHDWGYKDAGDHSQWRKENGLPPSHEIPNYPAKDRNITFPASTQDAFLINEVETVRQGLTRTFPLVVVACGAGQPDRNISIEMRDRICSALHEEFCLVFVGRNYDRFDKYEPVAPFMYGVDLVDKLSVPGVCRLVQEADGLITCHSALNILGWLERVPQLLLYPPHVRDGHISSRDQWGFGVDFPECVHAEFSDFRLDPDGYIERFVKQVRANVVKKASK